MAQRKDWKIEVGAPEEVEAARLAKWRAMSSNERVAALASRRREFLGANADRLERTHRVVEVSRR